MKDLMGKVMKEWKEKHKGIWVTLLVQLPQPNNKETEEKRDTFDFLLCT